MSVKHQLASSLRRYILHSLLIHQRSHSPVYRTLQRATSLDRLQPLARADFSLYYTTRQMAALVVRHRHDLEIILPVPTNSSYRSSRRTLEQLLELAQQSLSANNIDTSFHSRHSLCLNTFKKDSPPLE